MKRLLPLLLALSLTLNMVSAPAWAAETPCLEVTKEEASLILEMTGLNDAYCGIQVTVGLSSDTDAAFEVDDALFQSRLSLYSTYVRNGDAVTVYIVSKSPLNDGERLRLGILHTEASAVSVSSIKLLTPEDLEGQNFDGWDLPEVPSDPDDPDHPDNPDDPDTPSEPSTPDTPDTPVTPSRPGTSSGRPSDRDDSADTETVRYRVEIPEVPKNGSLQVSVSQAKAGETVTVTAVPAEGFVLDSLTASAEDGSAVSLTALGGGAYRFVMPAAAVTIRASFAAIQQEEVPGLPFLDVPEDMWYYEAVSYAYTTGLMGGVSAAAFAPDGITTRGQIVTILHRLEGEPPAMGGSVFADVPAGQWYTNAVNWAAEESIVDGYGNGCFGPDDSITREQLAAILFRYIRSRGLAEGQPGDLTAFADVEKVSSWALEAMAWANGCGLIAGKNGNLLDPTGNATRAEAATILMRFCEGIIHTPSGNG